MLTQYAIDLFSLLTLNMNMSAFSKLFSNDEENSVKLNFNYHLENFESEQNVHFQVKYFSQPMTGYF